VKRSRISAVGSPTAMVRVMSVVPSSYWAPEVDQKQLTRRNDAIAPAGDAVMYDRAVGTRAGDGRKGISLSSPVSRRKLSSAATGVDLGELATRGLAIEPGEKARDGGAVAMCAARAPAISISFFTAFISAIGTPRA